MWRCVHTSARCGLGIAGNVTSLIGLDVPRDNLWSDSAAGDSGSFGGGLLQRAKL